MADEPLPIAAEPVAAPAPAAAVAEAPAPAAVEAPAPEAAASPAPEVVAEAPAAEAIVARPSLLSTAKADGEAPKEPPAEAAKVEPVKEEPKPPEAVKEGEEPKPDAPKPEDVKAAEPEPIVYTDWVLPEGAEVDKDKVGKFTELLGTHRAPQELGQKLVDFHMAEMAEATQRLQQHNWDVWNRQQDAWMDEFRADRELGGNKELTTLSNCASVIDQYGGSPAQQAQLRQVLTDTGAGNHPLVIRLLNNVAKVLKEGSMAPAPKAPAPTASRSERRYTK